MIKLKRRDLIKLTAFTTMMPMTARLWPVAARADERKWLHGMSLFGDLKYPEGFEHFDYVNPDAPKTGRVRMYGLSSFDSLNPFTFKGSPAGLVGMTYDSLFASALDEPSTSYGLIASEAAYPEDYSSVTYRLRPQARFHDGSPITPEDVIWSMQALRKANPRQAFYYQNIERAEQTGDNEVTFFFSVKGNRELPHITAQLTVLPKKWWTGRDENGKQRDLGKTTLEIPLGNGAYKVKEFKTGDWVVVERVKDYWAADLPVNRGQHNFDEIKQIFFRDQNVAVEAFKGDQYDWREENNSKIWATAYKFPAVKDGRVIVEEIPNANGTGMQGFCFNTRRKLFRDPMVRHAFNYVFDFEWSNKNLFFGQYKRTASYFSNSELAATGLPSKEELEILQPLRGKIPDEVFTQEFKNPVNNNRNDKRNNMRKAARMLAKAGWKPGKDRVMRNAQGEAMSFEILLVSPAFERIVLPYAQQLKKLGIKVRVRTVDAAQYVRRVQNFDFDVIVANWGQSLSPGNEQRNYWGSKAADREGSRNYIGIKDEAIDTLIDRIIFAKSRADLIVATKALDRVLLWNHFVVPMWHIPYDRTARWNRFGRPDKLPEFSNGFPTIWWYDEEKAKKTGEAR